MAAMKVARRLACVALWVVASGCIRLVNDDVIYLYDRTPLESRVVVLN